jgi:tol-pal system protein YbgF
MKRITQLWLIVLLGVASSAHAGTKEDIARLQADVLALQNQIRLLEKAFAERTDGIRSLVVQLNDQVGKSSLVLGKISTALESQSSADTPTLQAVLKEVRDLSSKMDDANTRISVLAQQIADMKVQSKPITQRLFQTIGDNPGTLSADQIYREAYSDLVQGNFDLAIQGFQAFLKDFPTNDKADDAQYSIGEAYYNSNKFPDAIAAFSKVVADYATGGKAASALFKRGMAELALQQKDNAIADFKTVIDKYSTAPEASLAKAELGKLGINVSKTAPPIIKKRPDSISS